MQRLLVSIARASVMCGCFFHITNVYGIELIENGSFEADGPIQTVSFTGWDNGPGRSNDIGFASVLYCVPDDPPICPDAYPGGAGDVAGKSWGAANGDGHRGSATQVVDLAGLMAERFQFSAWLAASSRPDDQDYAIVSLEFFAGALGSGSSLDSLIFDGNDQQSTFIVGSANKDGLPDPSIPATQDNWTLYRASGIIPINALSAAVVIRGAVPPGDIGFGNDALVDLVSLQVNLLPGDYDGNQIVDQTDLDLVLLNWGAEATPPPDGWTRNLPSGRVDQAELDAVLLNWGAVQPVAGGAASVPEPRSFLLLIAVAPLLWRSLSSRVHNKSGSERACHGAAIGS